jgi:hypothetical protein
VVVATGRLFCHAPPSGRGVGKTEAGIDKSFEALDRLVSGWYLAYLGRLPQGSCPLIQTSSNDPRRALTPATAIFLQSAGELCRPFSH